MRTPQQRAKHAAYMRNYYARRRERMLQWQRDYRKRYPERVRAYKRTKTSQKPGFIATKKFLRELRGGQPCADCGGRFHYSAMDFDHRPGTVKAFKLNLFMTRSAQAVRDEVMKCDVVCANCHRIRTWQRAQHRRDVL